jgi:cell division septation protein DedD
MTASRGRGLRPGGVVRALGRLSLLVGFGFVAGLLIGVLSEEPELLAGHLRGEGEVIVLTPGEVAETPAGQAPSETEVEQENVERTVVMETRPEEKPNPNLPVVGAEAPVRLADSKENRPWAIQVGAFADEASAARLAEDLAAKGFPTELLTASGSAQRWRVRVQPLHGEVKAKETAVRLKQVERLPTWVLPMEGRAR